MAGIRHVFTITRVAEMVGEDEDWLHDLCIEMDPEDGRLIVLGPEGNNGLHETSTAWMIALDSRGYSESTRLAPAIFVA